MRKIYEASGWSEDNEAPEGANGEVFYLLLFQHPAKPPASITAAVKEDQDNGSEEDDAKQMASIVDALIGFVAAEFSVESGKASLYIVELQLVPKARRKGLGAKLTAAAVSLPVRAYADFQTGFSTCVERAFVCPAAYSRAVFFGWRIIFTILAVLQELLAWSRGLERVVLTVQTANRAALAFYARQGYAADPTSPEQCPEDFTAEDRTYRRPDGGMDFSYRILCKDRPVAWQRQQKPQVRRQREAGATAVSSGEKATGSEGAAKRRRQETTSE